MSRIWGLLGLCSLACGGSGNEGGETGGFDYCGAPGPKPGVTLDPGTRADDCDFDESSYSSTTNEADAERAQAELTEINRNACTWRVTFEDDGEVLDEGSCATAIANEASGGLQLFMQSLRGRAGSDDFVGFTFQMAGDVIRFEDGERKDVSSPVLWCDVEDGVELSGGVPSTALSGPVTVSASYKRAVPGTASFPGAKGVVSSFDCQSNTEDPGGDEDTLEASVTIESVERWCWFTNSFVYRVRGSASFKCEGVHEALASRRTVHIEVEF